MTRTLADNLMGTGLSSASANLISEALTELGAEAIPDSEKGQPGGVASLDGNGKVPADQLPPLQHETEEAASQAEMLALDVAAPAVCIRTDFTPPHMFYLRQDPASTLANWTDTGEFGAGAANPTATVGLVAKNGVASTYMRSDGAPAIDQGIKPTWTDTHVFSKVSDPTNSTLTVRSTTPRLEFSRPDQPDRLIFEYTSSETLQAQYFTAPGVGSIKPLLINPAVFAVEEVFFKAEYDSSATDSTITAVTNLPQIEIKKANAAADAQRWVIDGGTANTLLFKATNDAGTVSANFLEVTRTAAAVSGIASNSGAGAWAHTGNLLASGTIGSGNGGASGVSLLNDSGVATIQATGAGANVNLNIKAKGTGTVNLFGTVSAAALAVAGQSTFGGNVAVAGTLGSAANTTLPSPTNSGITLGGAPTWAMQSFYDQSLTANNRTADLLFITNQIKFRFVNDARNAFLDVFSITGGQAMGVTGITSTSGTGAWVHTGEFATTKAISTVTGTDGNKLWLAKYSSGSGHTDAPKTLGAASTYIQVGGREYGGSGFSGIGFGYVADPTQNAPVWIGHEETQSPGNTAGDFIVATRPGTTNVAPTERLRVTAAGAVNIAGAIGSYNGVPTVGIGTAPIYAKYDLAAQGANIAATTLFAVPTGAGGTYRMTGYLVVTRAGTTSSMLPDLHILWTDVDTSVALSSGPVTPTNAANQLGAFGNGDVIVHAKEGTNIQFQTSNYASAGATAMQYALHLKLEFLGA